MRRFIFIIFLFICSYSKAQTVFKIYFEYGKSTPKELEYERFDHWIQKFDIIDIDSIELIGFADSVGKIENNLKLSFKRANTLKKYIENNYHYDWPITTIAKGEKNKKIEERDRRVEVRIKLRKIDSLNSVDTIPKQIANTNQCYLIDYELLQVCFVSYVMVKDKPFVKLYLEHREYDQRRKIKYFYVSYDSGKKILHRVKFIQKESGKKWYNNVRYEALIPRANFLKDKIVYNEKLSCDSCFKDSLIAVTFYNGTCFGPDVFLNRNTSFKFGFFNLKYIKIRVPSMFVDSSLDYYDGKTGLKLDWIIKKRKPEYRYAKLDFSRLYTNGIYRKWPCCGMKSGDGGFRCGTLRNQNNYGRLIEIGLNRLSNEELPYVGLGYFFRRKQIELDVVATVSKNYNLGYRVRIKAHLIELPIGVINPFITWQNINTISNKIYRNTFNLYLGSEYREAFNYRYAEQDVFIGGVNNHDSYSVFLHYGVGYRFHGPFDRQLRRLFQIGIMFKNI